MRKEEIKIVPKVCGEELWLVNSDKYCGKLLTINKGAKGSYHYHKIKEETFFCLYGDVLLTIQGEEHHLGSTSNPITVNAGDMHSIEGIRESVILEVSTPHNDDDVYRLTESKNGMV